MKKVGYTTVPFRYDLNQIPYDYTVELRNRFKGLDLIDRMPDELWMEVPDIVQETGIKTRQFRYDLNQIPYDYTVEVRNRFKGLDLIECLTNYGWRLMTLYRRQGARPSPRKRNAKRQNGCPRRLYE